MPVLESKLERDCCNWAVFRGVESIKIKRRGWPDRGFLVGNGKIVFIEFKRKGKKPRALQDHVHELLARRGYEIWVIDSKGEFEYVISSNLKAPLGSRGISSRRNKVASK